jgi:hypothetical protein
MTQAERNALANQLASSKQYSNERVNYPTFAARDGEDYIIVISAKTRDAIIAALRAGGT